MLTQLWVLLIETPFLISALIFGFSGTRNKFGRYGRQWIAVVISWWLAVVQLFLYVIQSIFPIFRDDPFIPGATYSGFPSEPTFYCTFCVASIIMATLLWNITISPSNWAILLFVLIAPGSFLVFMGLNVWQEVLYSFIMALIAAALPVLVIRFYLLESVPLLMNVFPFSTVDCVDTVILEDDQLAVAEEYYELRKQCFG